MCCSYKYVILLPETEKYIGTTIGGGGNLLYAYKFSQDVYFPNAPHLTILAILILQMAACSCILVPYACKFSHFIFAKAR